MVTPLGAIDMNPEATTPASANRDHRLVAVEIAAKIGEANLRRRNFGFLQQRVLISKSGSEPGAATATDLAFQILKFW